MKLTKDEEILAELGDKLLNKIKRFKDVKMELENLRVLQKIQKKVIENFMKAKRNFLKHS